MRPRSIQWRIQLWHSLLLALVVTTLLIAFYQNQRKIIYQDLDRQITAPLNRILPHLASPHHEGRPKPFDHDFKPRDHQLENSPANLEEIVAQLVKDDIFVISWNKNNKPDYQSTNAPTNLLSKITIKDEKREREEKAIVNGYSLFIHATPRGQHIIIGSSIQPIEDKLFSLALRLIGIGFLTITAAFLVETILITYLLRPIQKIRTTAFHISQGQLNSRIPVKASGSELDQLSVVLNETFEKLEKSFEHQTRFTADASHEMRTPISVILAKSQLALSRERSPEKYQECLQTCIDSAQHMRMLTDSLLELAKFDSGQFVLKRQHQDLLPIVKEVMQMIEPLVQEKNITIHADLNPAPSQIDPSKIKQAILNLFSNAVKYNKNNGAIYVSLSHSTHGTNFTIKDTGLGISQNDLSHIFYRFYRVNKARTHSLSSNKRNGTGLGLAITKAIIEAHNGKIIAESKLDKGTSFTITLSH